MSAVIWVGIVAVWVFVLIPTWVRRGDLHWHRGSAVVAQGPAPASPDSRKRGFSVPGVKRLRRRSRSDSSIEVEAMAVQDEQITETAPAQKASPVASRERVAAAPSSGRLSTAVRATMGTGPKEPRKKQPLRVRRARRLVALAAIALGTLIAAIFMGGALIVVTLPAFVALALYVRHLRIAAREQHARVAREKRARAARQAWDEASAQERARELAGWRTAVAEPTTQPYAASDLPVESLAGEFPVQEYAEVGATEESAVGKYAGEGFAGEGLAGEGFVDEEYAGEEYAAQGYSAQEYAVDEAAPEQIDLTMNDQPALIDLSDAPTEELVAAKAS